MLLRIENLQTHFQTGAGIVPAVDGLSLEVPRGSTVALVGESGCGKSVTALSILRLLPRNAQIAGGSIRFDCHDMTTLSRGEMRRIRGRKIAMIFQEPMTSLNPVLTVGRQIAESLELGDAAPQRPKGRNARRRAIELLARVGIPAPEERFAEYPHRLSGGMRQRVMIAMALARTPDLLIADEPTTALDVTIQAQILDLLKDLQCRTGMAMLLVTHDFGVVAQAADFVSVMYAGRIVEHGPVETIFDAPAHPYTAALLRSMPSSSGESHPARRLPTIPGEVPHPLSRPPGCPFHPRCEPGTGELRCRTEVPALAPVEPGAGTGHACACWKSGARSSAER